MRYQAATIHFPLIAREEVDKPAIKAAQEVWSCCNDMALLEQETFHVLTLDSRNVLKDRHIISIGLIDCCLVHPREVFRPAIADSAAAVILVHNHPTGNTIPSNEDIKITKQLIKVGKDVVDIRILDHVIIGRGFFSMRDEGICSF